jgi:dTDP-4-amino-4,6-dideoxygalactose transaminase
VTATWEVPLTEIHMSDEDVAAVMDVYASGWLTMGPRTKEFEAALAGFSGVPRAVAVSSGTAALHLACRAAGVGPGDEVIVPALTFLATAHAPRYCGATVVLADATSEHDPNVSVADVERRITPRTRAVIAVDLFGTSADTAALRALCDRHGLVLIEDMAQAIGARRRDGAPAGSAADLACLSFFSKKQLPLGEGGAVLTASDERAATVASLRSHAMTSGTWDRHRGHSESYDVVDIGHNYRLDEPRAALGISRLRRLADDLAARRHAVERYRARLAGVDGIALVGDDVDVACSSHFAFPVRTATTDLRIALRSELPVRGIQTTRYPVLPALTEYAGHADGSHPSATTFADRHVCLPLWGGIGDDAVDRVCDAIAAVCAS